jgi:hypothetical protein
MEQWILIAPQIAFLDGRVTKMRFVIQDQFFFSCLLCALRAS